MLFLYNNFIHTDEYVKKEMFIYALINILFGNQKLDFNMVLTKFLGHRSVDESIDTFPETRTDLDATETQLSRWIELYLMESI